MLSPFYISVAAGFIAVGLHKYILSPGWSVKTFLATEPRKLIQALLLTCVGAYFAFDVAALMPGGAADALTKAPKLAGFAIGIVLSGTDAANVILNIVEIIPVVGPIIASVFRPKA